MNVPTPPGALRRLDEVSLAIATVSSIAHAKELRDQAAAVQTYVKRAGFAREVQNRSAILGLRIDRRLGELLQTIERRRRGEHRRETPEETSHDGTFCPTLKDLGVTRSQSSRWQTLAGVPEALFEAWVARRTGEGQDVTQKGLLALAREVRCEENTQSSKAQSALPTGELVSGDLHELVSTGRRFGTVLADPPWSFANTSTRGAARNHYPTLSLDDIASLPVSELVADNALLHVWVPSSLLFDAEFVIRSWGFRFVSSFVWVKPQIGLGNYWRVSHEFLLTGVRGSSPFRNHSLRSWIHEPRTVHSSKPEIVHTLVEDAGSGPFLELFGRKPVPGWTVFGNEVSR